MITVRPFILLIGALAASGPGGVLAQNRPTDLLRNLPALATSSLDRFHLDIYGRGLEGPLSGPTQVLVDGLPVAHTFLGAVSWNALPFATAATDSISWDPSWFNSPGHDRSDGTIRIHTRREPGRHLRFSFSALNETGDPGPSRFQQADDRNVDRSGPTMEILASSTRPAAHIEAGYRFDEHHMTDPALSDRVWSSYNGVDRPRVRIHAPWARIDATPGVYAISALAHGRLQRDFRFVPEFGREWPTEEEDFSGIFQIARLRSDEPVSPRPLSAGPLSARPLSARPLSAGPNGARWDTGLRIWGRDLTVASRPLRTDAPSEINAQQAGGHVWLRRCDFLRCWRLTAGLRGSEVTATGLRSRDVVPSARLDVTSADVDAAVMLFTTGSALRIDAPLSASGVLTLRVVKARSAALNVHVLAERSTPHAQLTLLSLWREGVDFGGFMPSEPYVGVTFDPGFSTRTQRLEIGAELTLRQLPGWAGRLVREALFSSQFRDTKGITATRRVDQLRERMQFFHRESHVLVGLEGRALSATVDIAGTRPVSIWYRYHRMLSRGDVLWWQTTSGLAPHTIGLEASAQPVRRIRLGAFVAAESPRSFPDRSHSALSERPWLLRTEFSVTKHLLGDTAAATFVLVNVTDAPLTLHPDAGNEQLAARIHFVVTL